VRPSPISARSAWTTSAHTRPKPPPTHINTLKARYGDDITIHGPTDPAVRGATLSFQFKNVHPHDVSQVLDQANVCVRAGHHCAKPLMKLLGSNATARASFYIYNSTADADALADALANAGDLFGF